MKEVYYTNGTAAFVNLINRDVYMGEESKTWDMTVTLDEGEDEQLESLGVIVKKYNDTLQRKFKTKFSLSGKVKMGPDGDIQPIDLALLTYGAKVRVKWSAGEEKPITGVPALLEGVRVLEMGGGAAADEADDEF